MTVTGSFIPAARLVAVLTPLLAFGGGAAAQPAAPSPAETALWAEVRTSRQPDDLQAYLDAYPQGAFAPLARRRLAALGAGDAPAGRPGTAPSCPARPGDGRRPGCGSSWPQGVRDGKL